MINYHRRPNYLEWLNAFQVFLLYFTLNHPITVDARGRTNLERMNKKLAPLGPDGKSINLHHTTQRNTSLIAEVTQTIHKENSSVIHINPNTIPSGINRTEFNKWRTDYWKYRANDF